MSHLAFSPTDDYDLLALVADPYSAPGKVRMDDFRQACLDDALAHRGWFLDKTDVLAPIDPTHSKGNGGKAVRLRRWRDWTRSGSGI